MVNDIMNIVKKLVLFVLVLLVQDAKAQLNFFAKAGMQIIGVGIIETRTPRDEYKKKWGCYAGGQLEYITHDKTIFFVGAGLSLIRYEQKLMEMADAIATYNYKLLYLDIPVGFGYQFGPAKKVNFNLYLGGYCNIGMAGKSHLLWQSFYSANGPGYNEYRETEKIRFGAEENMQDDFRKANAGLQTGFSIGFFQKLHVDFLYKHGISNILTKSEAHYESRKLRMLSFGLKYAFKDMTKEKRNPKASIKKGF